MADDGILKACGMLEDLGLGSEAEKILATGGGFRPIADAAEALDWLPEALAPQREAAQEALGLLLAESYDPCVATAGVCP